MITTPRQLLVPRDNPRLLSLVIPVYNEQQMLPILRRQLTDFLPTLTSAVEVVLINDGSSDNTLEQLVDWAGADTRIKVLGLARNFGHQAAVTAGLDAAGGDAVVIVDADLQDPLNVIHEMIGQYRAGYDVVYGQRISRRGESGFKRLTAWAFYRFMRAFVHRDLPPDTGDFRLISQSCLVALRQMRETHRFLRGMVAWVGFAQTAVRYERQPRAAGESKYSLGKMSHFAWTAAFSFSAAPLRLSLALGMLVAGLGVLGGVYAIVAKLIGAYTVPGWASQMVIMSLLGGAILVSNGILGEYIGRMFEQLKGRPLYIVSRSVNVMKADPKGSTLSEGKNFATDAAPMNTDNNKCTEKQPVEPG